MWLPPRVGAAEAALATVVVGGAALAASPTRARRLVNRAKSAEQSPDPGHSYTVMPSAADAFLSGAWAALRRAVMAAVTLFDDVEYDDLTPSSSNASDIVEGKEPTLYSLHDWCSHFPIDDPASGLALACCQPDQQHVAAGMRHHTNLVDAVPTPPPYHQLAAEEPASQPHHPQTNAETSDNRTPQNPALEDRLYMLRSQFKVIFEQNGGADCVARIKEIGDDPLTDMWESMDSGTRIAYELADAKLFLDDVLRRVDAMAKASVTENHSAYVHAASAANAVIDETKQNSRSSTERRADLIVDDSRLLAVFATNVCASILRCLEKGDQRTAPWNERAERIMDVTAIGITQLRAVSRTFARAISELQASLQDDAPLDGTSTSWPVEIRNLNEVAIEHVLRCVALAIAALQNEIIERACHCTKDT